MDKIAATCTDDCCAPPALILPPRPSIDRRSLVRDAFRLEWLTITWMSVEAIVILCEAVFGRE